MTQATNAYIAAAAYLLIMLLTLSACCRPLQTVIKIQKGAYIIWTQQELISFLSEKFVTNFSDLFLNFQASYKGDYLKKFRPYQCTDGTTNGNFLILFQMVLLPNTIFLISKQNNTSKNDPKMLN